MQLEQVVLGEEVNQTISTKDATATYVLDLYQLNKKILKHISKVWWLDALLGPADGRGAGQPGGQGREDSSPGLHRQQGPG